MSTNLGSYTGQTVNGTTFVGPNDEANNHPRLGVGCLITPFGVTALPVVPTNTRIYVDEIFWAKTAIDQTGITALFNIMPDKENADYVSGLMTASALIVNPAINTDVVLLVNDAECSAILNDAVITADRNIIISVQPANASAEMLEAQRIDNISIASDVLVATAIFNDAGVLITIPAAAMLANAQLANNEPNGILVNGVNLALVYSAWVRYLRGTDVDGIISMRRVG